jgi:hypothetical protein
MDKQSTASSAYRGDLRRANRRAPSKLVSTRASGASRYNKHSSLGRHCITSSLISPGMALLKTMSGECHARTFYGTTSRAKNPKQVVRQPNKAQVHGKRHTQHQPLDRDDETVHDHYSRLWRTRREDPSPTLHGMGTQHNNTLRKYYPPVLRLMLGVKTRAIRS